MSSTSAKIHKRLSKVIANDVSKELKDTRMMLQVFIDKIHYEGIAEFAAKIPSGLEYSKKEFVVNYLMAKDSAKEFNKLWAIFLKTTKINLKRDYQVLSKKFEGNKIPYIIGLHMTHTIKYVFVDVTFQEIAKFSRFKFLKKYEEAMSHGDLKPILTRESNEGIIDYNRILGDLTDLYHKNL